MKKKKKKELVPSSPSHSIRYGVIRKPDSDGISLIKVNGEEFYSVNLGIGLLTEPFSNRDPFYERDKRRKQIEASK